MPLLDGLLRRLRPGRGDRFAEPIPEPRAEPLRHIVDANTRTFWSRGASAESTLVEAETPAARGMQNRAAALIERHERGALASRDGRPRANPAFSEAVFVELMRAHRYERAFDLLAPECQRRWGDAALFSEAQRGGALRHLQGVRVAAVRHLERWTDPATGLDCAPVAELDVEYTLDNGRQRAVVPRTVHLVGVAGKWRSLCYPEGGTGEEQAGSASTGGFRPVT